MKRNTLYIILGIVIGIIIAGSLGYFLGTKQATQNNSINSYKDCIAAGHPVLDSYPEQCRTPDGRNFTNTAQTAKQSVALEGKIVCLPHEDTAGPQDLKCMTGLQADSGSYYMLDAGSSGHELATGGDRKVRVSGILELGGNGIYQSEGTITVDHFEFL